MSTLNISMRPKTFDEFIGSETEIKAIRSQIAKNIPRAFCLSGTFGVGKTTLAYLIAKEVQEGRGEPFINEVNAASVTGIDAMRELIRSSWNYPFTGIYGIIILDEAHKLSKPAQESLLKEFEARESPTVWIICTTDPEKLVEGLRAGRCFSIALRGMTKNDRNKLIKKAAKELDRKEDYTEFLDIADKSNLISPRKLLMAFEAYNSGIPAGDAIGSMHFENLPEYWEICMGVVFGKWDDDYILPWIKDKNGKARMFDPIGKQLRLLDDKLKKKTAETNVPVEDEDLHGRPEAANSLLAITAATLKNQIIGKTFNPIRAKNAADSLFILSHCRGEGFGMEFATAVGGLFRINQKMQGK
jgi:hypothetical protein